MRTGVGLYEFGTWLAQKFQLVRRDGNGDAAFNLITLVDIAGFLLGLGFTGSAGLNGYVVIPLGITRVLICWGREDAINASTTRTFTLPEAFGSTNYAILASYRSDAASGYSCASDAVSTTQAQVRNNTMVQRDIYWIAAGAL